MNKTYTATNVKGAGLPEFEAEELQEILNLSAPLEIEESGGKRSRVYKVEITTEAIVIHIYN